MQADTQSEVRSYTEETLCSLVILNFTRLAILVDMVMCMHGECLVGKLHGGVGRHGTVAYFTGGHLVLGGQYILSGRTELPRKCVPMHKHNFLAETFSSDTGITILTVKISVTGNTHSYRDMCAGKQ